MSLLSISQELDRERRVTVVGAGYVGLSLAVLFARYHDVFVLEIDDRRVCGMNRISLRRLFDIRFSDGPKKRK